MLDLKIMCQKLEKIRKNAKLSRRALSDISGFNERTILSYERAERLPSDRYLEFVSLYFGYTKESILNDKSDLIKLDKFVNCLLMYQSIFNYDDKEMDKLLHKSHNDLDDIFKIPNKHKKTLQYQNLNDKYKIPSWDILKSYDNFCNFFTIKKSATLLPCVEIKNDELVILDENYTSFSTYKTFHNDAFFKFKIAIEIALKLNIKPNNLFNFEFLCESKYQEIFNLDKIFYGFYDCDEIRCLATETSIIINELEKTGLEITPSYYASIIKKRNNPETLTPKLITDTLPKNHKKLIDLLPYASDEFINEVIEILEKKKNLSKL